MMNIEQVALLLCLKESDILALFPFGSQVYGTQRPDSDRDFICVAKKYPTVGSRYDLDNVCVHIYKQESFLASLANHDIQALECYFSPSGIVTKAMGEIPFQLDKGKLRKAISTVANHSWVKGKKKLIVAADYEKILAVKSVFHSIRILDFGLQVLTSGKIHDFQSMNWLYHELWALKDLYEREELWELVYARYHSTWKEKKARLRALAPKQLIPHQAEKEGLIAILEQHQVKPSKELVKAILEHFG